MNIKHTKCLAQKLIVTLYFHLELNDHIYNLILIKLKKLELELDGAYGLPLVNNESIKRSHWANITEAKITTVITLEFKNAFHKFSNSRYHIPDFNIKIFWRFQIIFGCKDWHDMTKVFHAKPYARFQDHMIDL